MNLTCQCINYLNEDDLNKAEWFWFWELIAWTAFFLYLRLFIMLRSIELLSASITMILRSFSAMVPYFIIVVMGVMAFTNTFLAVRQVVYIKHAADETISDDEKVERPYEKDIKVTSLWDFKDKWIGEYMTIFQEVFVGAVIGLDGSNSLGFNDTQWIIFLVAIIFNTIILMNLLLAIVAFIQGDVHVIKDQYYYKNLVQQICQMQRVFFNEKKGKKGLLFMAKACGEHEITAVVEDTVENEISEHAETIDYLKKTMDSVNKKLEDQIAEKKASESVKDDSGEKHTFAKSK